MRTRLFRTSMISLLLATAAFGAAPSGGWSSNLLDTLLKEEPVPAAAPVNQEGMALRTYQLRNLRLGEAGRSTTLVQLLQRLLPPGSELREDVQANSLHVLTTTSAHSAAWDYLTAVDIPAPSQVENKVPEEVTKALEQFSHAANMPGLLAKLDAVNRSVDARLSDLDEKQAGHMKRIALGMGLGLVLVAGFVWWMMRRNRSEQAVSSTTSLALDTQSLQLAMAPLHAKVADESMQAMNKLAIHLEGWAANQRKERERLESSLATALEAVESQRRDSEIMLNRLASGSDRIEQGVQSLAAQTDKVGAMAEELSRAITELDQTRDEIVTLRAQMAEEKASTERQKQALAEKERVLIQREALVTKQQATLAALQVMLEDGDTLPPGAIEQQESEQQERLGLAPVIDDVVFTAPDRGDTTPYSKVEPAVVPTRFMFLPPDAKEV